MKTNCPKCGYVKPVKVTVLDMSDLPMWKAKAELYELVMEYQEIDIEELKNKHDPYWRYVMAVAVGQIISVLAYLAGIWL